MAASTMPNNSATAEPRQKMDAPREAPDVPNDPLDMTVLGMCSGAAFNGVSCALIHYRQQSPEHPLRMAILEYEDIDVPLRLRTLILNLLRDHPRNPKAMVHVHGLLGHMYATAAKRFCSHHKIALESVHLIASRAGSIPPSVKPPTPASPPGEPDPGPSFQSWTAVVAAETGITTATNLPMTRRPVNALNPSAAPPIDTLLLQHATKFRVCLTINDLAIITMIPPSSSAEPAPRPPPPSSICGPGTMFIDYAMRYATSAEVEMDPTGAYAAHGRINEYVVRRFLERNDYAARAPPLAIATEMFGGHEVQALIDECLFLGMEDADTIATITRITAENIVRQYRRLVAAHCPADRSVDEVFICGPGAQNTEIVDYMEEVLPDEVVTRPLADIGIPGSAKEAACVAQLGVETVLRYAVGEDGPFEVEKQGWLVGGIVRGREWGVVREMVMGFGKGAEVPAVRRVVVERRE